MNIHPLSRAQRLIGAGIAMAAGVGVISAVLGWLPDGAPAAPPGLEAAAVAAGAAFLGVGLLLAFSESGRWRGFASLGAVLVVVGVVAAINIVAFGPGIRDCTRAITGLFDAAPAAAGDTECRVVAGIAATYANAMITIFVLAGICVINDHKPWTRPIDLMWKGLVLVLLAPLLAIAFVVMYLTGHGDDVRKGFASFSKKQHDPPPK